jgi:1,4-dihydroxy-2-naphthoyl-CoA hydrolase
MMPKGDAAPTASPGFDVTSLDSSGAFVKNAGLIVDTIDETMVVGHIDLTAAHHTPWGIVHGGVYATAVESAASIGATAAVINRGQVAVGLTNTTHFLRSLADGRVDVEAAALYQGRTHQLWRVDITDETGGLVAHGEVRLQNIAAK